MLTWQDRQRLGLTAGLEEWQETAYLRSAGLLARQEGAVLTLTLIPAASVPPWHLPQALRFRFPLTPVALEKPWKIGERLLPQPVGWPSLWSAFAWQVMPL
jgi:hypothetical protein